MPTIFTPDTKLGQAVQKLLLDNPSGLHIHEIRRQLRRQGIHVGDENSLRELLSHSRVFTSLSDGSYVLAGNESVADDPQPDVDPHGFPNPDFWSDPLVRFLPQARQSYVVFDLETTGTDPAHDHIIQIAALKVLDGIPTAVGNWYANSAGAEIPFTLQIKLGLADNPHIAAAIASAPDLQDVLPQFLAFCGDLPLVAFNARFDGRMLAAALVQDELLVPLVDALELAILLLPHLPSHRLEMVSATLGLPVDSLAEQWIALDLDSNFREHTVSSQTLHNAVTDVYVLFRIYESLLNKLDQPGPAHALLALLLPEAFEVGGEYRGVTPEVLSPFAARCDWGRQPSSANSYPNVPDAPVILQGFLAAKGLQPRNGQLEMQQLIVQALADERFAMVEAPTGTGKTLSYLTAAVHQAVTQERPVALSTAYRNLQDQLLAEIADLQEHGRVAFRAQLLKGVANYLCWSQVARYLDEGSTVTRSSNNPGLTFAERFVLAFVILWLPGSQSGTADEISFWLQQTLPVARSVINQLRATSACHPNLQQSCIHCPMPAAYANARQADILVLNHALWLADPQRLPPFARIVLDEAHTLEDVATSALTKEVSSQSLGEILDYLYDERTQRGLLPRIRAVAAQDAVGKNAAGAISAVRRAKALVEDFGPSLVRFIRQCTEQVDPRYGASLRLEASPAKIHSTRWTSVQGMHQQLFDIHLPELGKILTQLRSAVSETPGLPYRDPTLRELADCLDKLLEQIRLAYDLVKVADLKLVYWVEVGPPVDPESQERNPKPQWWAFKAAPIDVGEALQPYYDKLESANFVSATLALKRNDFSYFIERLGLADRLSDKFVRKLPPALPYETNVFLGLADYLTYAPLQHTMESFKEELAGELTTFLNFTDGRALGLFTARERMESIAGRITPELARIGIPLYVQRPDASRRNLLDSFKERKEAVLFGLRSFWEGVDAPGETLSFVLMEKLPFPLLIEPVHRARAERLTLQGKSEFDDYMLPLMMLQFKQGFGRLMRRHDDRGAVVLFDRRIHRKHYRGDLLSSLPGHLPRDEQAERSRKRFYLALAEALPGLIDLEAKSGFIADLPEDLILNLEAVLDAYRLPDVISHQDYDQWRPQLLTAMKALFGHDQFRTVAGLPAQEQVIRHMLAGEDVLGVLPTGSGKSLTFQLTGLLREGVTLVFSPLIALMKDQIAGLNEKGIEVVGAVYSGQSASERDDVLSRMRRSRARLVYVSPERLRDPQLLAALRDTRVVQVVVDEAHCVYMWGPSFRPDFLYLPQIFEVLGYRPPVAALTATATPAMQNAIVDALTLRQPARVIAPADRPELQFVVYNEHSRYGTIHSRNDRFKQLLRILQVADKDRPPILVYVATTVEADQLARRLQVAGFDARAYHGKMLGPDRTSVQEMFMDDHINIVVCTKAFGMGIDKPNIRYVIHYNMPSDLESYFQEAGRAGRDGEPAFCILLFHKSDVATQQYFIDNSTPDEQTINRVLSHLARLPDDLLFLDPDAVQEALGIEEVQLRVALHHLEAQHYLTRSADFTLTASLTFQVSPEEALDSLREAVQPDSDVLARVLRITQWPAFRKLDVDLLQLAQSLGVSPDRIDNVLLQLSQLGHAVYRPWRRGFMIAKTAKMHGQAIVPAGAFAAEQHRSEMRVRLDHMIAYAIGRQPCRRLTILNYFGQTALESCLACDVCQPERQWPWSLVTQRDFGTPDAFLDPPFVVLETVKWNLDRARSYGAPYGVGTLLAILKGDSFAATRFETDPHIKRWRLQQMRACPHWGVLAVLPARDRVLDETCRRLISEGFLIQRQQPRGDGQDPYDFLDLTPHGIDQLTSGKLLQWT